MTTSTISSFSPDAQAALSVCQHLLSSIQIGGDEGRKQFGSTLHPSGHMANARYFRGKGILFHSLIPGLPDYLTDVWANPGKHNEEIDGTPTVLVDHDMAMVWTPFWFRVYGELSHVGTNCFHLLKVYQDGDDRVKGSGQREQDGSDRWEWKVVMACDTARLPTDGERKRLDSQYFAR